MRAFTAVIALALVAGCGKSNKDKDSGGPGTKTEVPELHFNGTANGTGVTGHVDEDTILAQKGANLVLGAVGLAFADESVRSKMTEHGAANRSSHCWTGPQFPQSTFTLNYTPCEDSAGVVGGMIFNDDPLGPVGMDFKTVTFNGERSINGAMGFDATGANPLHWTLYDTRGTEPVVANRVPFNVEIGGREASVTFDGGGFMRGLNQNFAMWGVMAFTPYGGSPATVTIGGTDAAALLTPDEPAEPASLPWSYLSCRCPTVGLMGMDIGFDIEEITFDLDDLLTEEDEIDDPEVRIEAFSKVTGPAEARNIDCGEWEITYTAEDALTVELSAAELKAGIQNLCDTAVITDVDRCTALLAAADEVGSVTIEMGVNRLGTAVASEAAVEFDTSYCRP